MVVHAITATPKHKVELGSKLILNNIRRSQEERRVSWFPEFRSEVSESN